MLHRQLVERNPLEPGAVLAPVWIWVSLLFSVRVTWRILITFLLTSGLWKGCQFCFVTGCSSKVWENQFSWRQEPKDMPEPSRELFPKWVSRVRFQCMDTAGVGWRERWSARLNPTPLGHLRKPGPVWQFVQTVPGRPAALPLMILSDLLWKAISLSDFRLSQKTEPLTGWGEADSWVFSIV